MEEVYLDWNATTPLLPEVARAMAETATHGWANASSIHAAGRRARRVFDECREGVAVHFQAEARDVFLTSGGTEANNLALSGVQSLITSRLEHPSVTRFAEGLERAGVRVQWLPVPEMGVISVEDVAAALRDAPAGTTVAVMAVNHETGALQPVQQILALCRAHRARLHVDAVQAVGKVPAETYLGASSYSMAAHKLGGPKGIGALVFREGRPTPVLLGGAQEMGYRPGTQDAAAAMGLLTALRLASHERYQGLAPLRDQVQAALAQYGTANAVTSARAAHVANVSLHKWKGAEFVAAADLSGVYLASGSACSAGTSEPSAVIAAMLGAERALGAVRVSLGPSTTETGVARAIEVFHRLLGSQSSD